MAIFPDFAAAFPDTVSIFYRPATTFSDLTASFYASAPIFFDTAIFLGENRSILVHLMLEQTNRQTETFRLGSVLEGLPSKLDWKWIFELMYYSSSKSFREPKRCVEIAADSVRWVLWECWRNLYFQLRTHLQRTMFTALNEVKVRFPQVYTFIKSI